MQKSVSNSNNSAISNHNYTSALLTPFSLCLKPTEDKVLLLAADSSRFTVFGKLSYGDSDAVVHLHCLGYSHAA